MTQYIIKILVSSLLIVAVSEFAKKSSFVGSLFASIPLVSVLGIIWLYQDTGDIQKISDLSYGIFWLVILSLGFFLVFPQLLERGVKFYTALLVSIFIMVVFYFIMIEVLSKFGIKL